MSDPSVLFEGNDLIVRGNLELTGLDSVVITFSPRNPVGRRSGWGESFLAKHGIPHLCFVSRRNHWWQTAEVWRAIEQVQSLRLRSRFSSITTYGTSMGAFGALAFSGPLDADCALAFSPQSSINGRCAPWPAAWNVDTEGLEEIHRVEALCSTTARLCIFSDPFHAIDTAHAGWVRAHRDVELHPIPFAGHSAALALHTAGLLGPTVLNIIRHGVDAGFVRSAIRNWRQESLFYFSRLRALSKARRHRSTVFAFAGNRVNALAEGAVMRSLATDAPDVVFTTLTQRMAQADQPTAARWRGLLAAYAAACPASGSAVALHAACLEQIQCYEEAVDVWRKALNLDRKNVVFRLGLACALIRAGRSEEAERHLRSAISRKPPNKNIWLSVNEVVEGTDLPADLKAALRGRLAKRPAEVAPA